jgi:hypothetical protein
VKRLSKLLLLGAVAGGLASADTIVLATTPTALGVDDTVLWDQLGTDGAIVPNSFSVLSGGAISVNGVFSTTTGEVATAGVSWSPVSGAFNANDSLVWAFDDTASNGSGPIAFTFGKNVAGVGAAIQPDSPGTFTAQIQLYNGNTLLGSVTRSSNANGDALYIGALDQTAADVTRAVFSLTAVQNNPNNESNNIGDFAIDTLGLVNPAAATPEPATFSLVVLSLAGLAWRPKRAKRAE